LFSVDENMSQDRRTALGWLLGGGITASLASFLYPVIKFINPPDVPEASVNEVVAGNVREFKPGSGKIVKFGSKPVLLIRLGESDWRAFSAVCTHLNCTVQYQEARGQIWCACHNGLYDMAGRVVSGPPPRPLEEMSVNVRGQDVVISRRG
jgi:cytochrome b6-f complex iron-sulfur subunit